MSLKFNPFTGTLDYDTGVSAATTAASGKVELATTTETSAGTDTARVVTPDGLSGSIFGTRVQQLVVFAPATDIATGDGKAYFIVPDEMTGMDLVRIAATAMTAGTTDSTTIQIANVTDSQDMLSTVMSIESGETSTRTSASPGVIDPDHDDVATGDVLRIDVDAVSDTPPKGLIVEMAFRLSSSITFIASADAEHSGAASLAVNKPTGTAENDLMVTWIYSNLVSGSEGVLNSVPTGWTKILFKNGSSSVGAGWAYYKLAGSSEGSSYTWGFSTTLQLVIECATFRGINLESPIGNSDSDCGASGTDCTAPSITVQTSGNALIQVSGHRDQGTFTPPAGYSEAEDHPSYAGGGNAYSASFNYKLSAPAGASGTATAVAGSDDYWQASHIELKKAS